MKNYQKIVVCIPPPPIPGIGAYWPFCLWVPGRRQREQALAAALRGGTTLAVVRASWGTDIKVGGGSYPADFPKPWEGKGCFAGLYGRQILSLLRSAVRRGLIRGEQNRDTTVYTVVSMEKDHS